MLSPNDSFGDSILLYTRGNYVNDYVDSGTDGHRLGNTFGSSASEEKTQQTKSQMGTGGSTPAVLAHIKSSTNAKTQKAKTAMGSGWIAPSVFAHIKSNAK